MLRAVCARRHFRARHVAAGSGSAGHEAHEQSEREAIGWNYHSRCQALQGYQKAGMRPSQGPLASCQAPLGSVDLPSFSPHWLSISGAGDVIY